MKKEQLLEKFAEIYGDGGEIRCFFAPGRVNLIGEHTDYNGGHVFPCALTIGTYGVIRKREDDKLRFYSMNFQETGMLTSDLSHLTPSKEAGWSDYPKGVIWALGERGYRIPTGFDLLICGDIPAGSGLSSSASLEVLTGLMMKGLFGFEKLSMVEIAQISQYAENNFNGMNCGIMDQFASAMGKKDHAIFLDTATLQYEYAPVKMENAKIVITNSKVKHSLVDSKYNERRQQCEEAVRDLRKVEELAHIKSLGELDRETFEKYETAITDPICRMRARHAVCENQRTIQAVQALKDGDLAGFGRLMNASHVSLRDDYQVSCDEIDLLVDLAWEIPGVLGARITGGGFGGCTVSIVENEAVDRYKESIQRAYEKCVGHKAEFYVVDIGDGAYAF